MPTVASAWVFSRADDPMTLQELAVSVADLAPGELLVRLTAATVCGSDVHTYEGRRVDPAAPLVLGHEGVGVVELSARGDLPPGTRVSFSIVRACGACAPCTVWGLPQKCVRVFKLGHAPFRGVGVGGLAGTYASHIHLGASSVVVPLVGPLAHLPDAVVAPANCALATSVCALRTVARLLDLAVSANAAAPAAAADGAPPLRVLIQGAGLLGLYATALAKRWLGASFVAVTDVSPARLALAQEFGADAVLDTSDLTSASGGDVAVVAALHRAAACAGCAEFAGFDAALEVCGAPAAVSQGVAALRPGGVYALAGLVHPASSLVALTGEAVIRRCAVLAGVHNYAPRDLADGLAFLARTWGCGGDACEDGGGAAAGSGALPYLKLLSDPVPLSRLPDALALARTGRWPRVLVVPNDPVTEGKSRA